MKISKKIKTWCIPVLVALLAFPCLAPWRTWAAGGINLDEPCSLTVSVGIVAGVNGDNQKYLEDFNQMEIPVSVYQVAKVDVTGQNYTPVTPFESLDFKGLSSDHQADATAARWQELAKAAEEIRMKGTSGAPEVAGTTVLKKEEGSKDAAKGEIQGLEPGMYLVVPETSYNPDYTARYVFTPYLTALPSSEYALTGSGSDVWEYHTEIGLKPEAEPLYGNLNIRKSLNSYNPALGRATFVFHIVGTDENGVVQYDEVFGMDYTTGGEQTLTLEGIPAGLHMTVEEIYSGSSYSPVGAREAEALIQSVEAVNGGISGASEASVSFTNQYNGGNRGGYGVTNHFESDGQGGWNWKNPTGLLE